MNDELTISVNADTDKALESINELTEAVYELEDALVGLGELDESPSNITIESVGEESFIEVEFDSETEVAN